MKITDYEVKERLGEREGIFAVGDKARYIGATDEQVNWGSNDDPRQCLTEGAIYTVDAVEVHTWHTKIYLREKLGMKFNSVSFEKIREASK